MVLQHFLATAASRPLLTFASRWISSAPRIQHIRRCMSSSRPEPGEAPARLSGDNLLVKFGNPNVHTKSSRGLRLKLAMLQRAADRVEWLHAMKTQHGDQWEAAVAEADRQDAAEMDAMIENFGAGLRADAAISVSRGNVGARTSLRRQLFRVAVNAVLTKHGLPVYPAGAYLEDLKAAEEKEVLWTPVVFAEIKQFEEDLQVYIYSADTGTTDE